MGLGTICAGFPSSLGFGVGGLSCSNFVAFTVMPRCLSPKSWAPAGMSWVPVREEASRAHCDAGQTPELGAICMYHSIPHHIISYHVISYHIISYHIISYHIISYHIISYHIISYHIISYHIISYHIISYHSIHKIS